MTTRNITLTDRHETLIEELIASGRYQNASEVLREGLRLVERREAEDAAKLEALRDCARVGLGAIERGEARGFDDADALNAHLNALAARVVQGARVE